MERTCEDPPECDGNVMLYSQFSWHTEGFVCGDREGLQRLRDAITRALNDGQSQATVFAGDGEGFTLHVLMRDEEFLATKLKSPYTWEAAADNRDHVVWPSELVHTKEHEPK